MGILATENSKPRELIPEGLQDATCYLVVDLGTQVGNYGPKRQVMIGWEFPDNRIQYEDDSKPMVKTATFTLSLHEKANLRKVAEGWRGRRFTQDDLTAGFDISKMLGVNCQIQILHETKDTGVTYANISAILPPAGNDPKRAESFNEHQYFSFDDDMDIPTNLQDWILEKIHNSEEHSQLGREEPDGPDIPNFEETEDDIPF